VRKIGVAQIRIAQPRAGEVGADQRGAREIGTDQRRVPQIGLAQQALGEIDGAAAGLAPLLFRERERQALQIRTDKRLRAAPLVPRRRTFFQPSQMLVAGHQQLLDAARYRHAPFQRNDAATPGPQGLAG
jgi:hypothetical protein